LVLALLFRLSLSLSLSLSRFLLLLPLEREREDSCSVIPAIRRGFSARMDPVSASVEGDGRWLKKMPFFPPELQLPPPREAVGLTASGPHMSVVFFRWREWDSSVYLNFGPPFFFLFRGKKE
jgi:hypothetical protein